MTEWIKGSELEKECIHFCINTTRHVQEESVLRLSRLERFFLTYSLICHVAWFLSCARRSVRDQFVGNCWGDNSFLGKRQSNLPPNAKYAASPVIWFGREEVYNNVKTAQDDLDFNYTSVFKWCSKLKIGRTSVQDDQNSGRASIVTGKTVDIDRRFTVNDLIAQIPRSLLHKVITETLGYRKLSLRRVPKELTDQHKLNLVEDK